MNREHYEIIKAGVKEWNAWRLNDPDVVPDLIGVDLREIELAEMDFRRANLTGASMYNTVLTRSLFNQANLSGTQLGGANLREANLREANLCRANLSDANLTDANLSFADLTGADLANTYTCNTDFDWATGIKVIISDMPFTLFRWYDWTDECYKYNCGCHCFTLDQALAYWGSPDYPNKERGRRYVRAIKLLVKTCPW